MKTNRLFTLFVVIALVVTVTLTVRETAATTIVTSQKDVASQSSVACASLPSRYSIRSGYVQTLDAWVTITEDGPTGVDGGLIELLSSYRTCSK